VRGLFGKKLVIGALVILALGAVYALAGFSHPVALAAGRPAPPPGRAPVTTAIRACPSPGSRGGGGVAIIAAATPAGQAGLASGGTAVVSRLSAAGSASAGAPLITLSRPGVLTRTAVRTAAARSGLPPSGSQSAAGGKVLAGPSRGGVVVRATGSMARALAVEQTGAGGLPTAICNSPGTDFWFVGPGQRGLASMQLYLMNTDGQPADAEIDIYTDSGPLLGSTDTGIAVPAHGLLVQSLAKLVHGSSVVALHVRTSVGRVAAALRETKSASQQGAWLPASQPPAGSLVLPGLPASAGRRELYVAVPGAGNAQVKVTAVTAKGSYRPTGGGGIDLPGGSAVVVPLPSLAGAAAAVRITSNVPVTAAMLASGGPPGAPGVFTAGSAPIEEQGVIADNLSGSGDTSTLVLSAPRAAAQVRITEESSVAGQPPAGSQAARVISIKAKHTATVRLHAPSGSPARSPFAVVITPLAGSGPVYAGRVLAQSGTVESIFPVLSSLTSVPLPPVRDSLATVLP
jgi:Family of unknown function (DUF5719)